MHGRSIVSPDDLRKQVELHLRDVAVKLLVLSGKGGVGKTSLAVNLSVALADSRQSVCILDIDMHGPNVLRLLHLQGRMPEITKGRIRPVHFCENVSVVSPSFMVADRDTPLIWRGPMKAAAISQFFLNVEWGKLDYLVIDCPPGTGDEPLTAAQIIAPPCSAVLVTTPQEVALDDVRKAAAFCRRLGLPIAGIIENMSGMSCPHCGGRIDLYKRGGGKTTAAELGLTFLGEIPFDPGMVVASDKGVPFVREFANTPAGQAIAQIASRLPRGLRPR
jgi:Mrp family chromosome partitioning ATPase